MSIVKKHKVKVRSIESRLAGLYTLELESTGSTFRYHPGQFLHLSIDNEYDGIGQWPESRCFSMQSNPDEETIRITYAVKGRFTKQMEQQLRIGSEVWLKLPYGDLFTQPHNKVNTVFIAGGTGITPFLSLFTHKSFEDYIDPHIYLGFRSHSYNIYHNGILRLNNSSKFVKFFYEDEDGQIDIQHIFHENGPGSDYFISGPPAMIKSFKNFLIAADVPENQILTDDWE